MGATMLQIWLVRPKYRYKPFYLISNPTLYGAQEIPILYEAGF
jgi:hypothetical protein